MVLFYTYSAQPYRLPDTTQGQFGAILMTLWRELARIRSKFSLGDVMQFPFSPDSEDASGIDSHSVLDALNQFFHLDSQQHPPAHHPIAPDTHPEQPGYLPTPDLNSSDHSFPSSQGSHPGDHPLTLPATGTENHPFTEAAFGDRLTTFQDTAFTPAPDPFAIDPNPLPAPHPQSQDTFSSHHLGATNYSEHTPVMMKYTESGAITPEDPKAIELIGNDVWWKGYGWGHAGTIAGHQFYRGSDCIGRLGANLKVYDSGGHYIGYVTPKGDAYTPNGRLFATGGTVRWAAATLVFNTCTEY